MCLHSQQQATRSPLAPVSYEDVIALGMEEDDDDALMSESDASMSDSHPTPFVGVAANKCNIEGCTVTATAGGRAMHKCDRKTQQQAADAASASSSSSPFLSLEAFVVLSLPDSLLFSLNSVPFTPSPFDRIGVWRSGTIIDRMRKQREEIIRAHTNKAINEHCKQQQQQHVILAP